jgi:GNAT superfamily N-acetyltransferase
MIDSLTSPTPIVLRTAVPADALCLGALGMQVFLDTYATEGIRPGLAREALDHFSTDAMAAALAAPGAEFIVAERAGHLVGFAELAHGAGHALVNAAPACELARLYVQEPFTGIGLGRRLLREAEARAAARGARVLWLHTWIGNARARAFYPRCGYADVGLTHYEFDGQRFENRAFARMLRGEGGSGLQACPRVQRGAGRHSGSGLKT